MKVFLRFVQWVDNELRELPTYEGFPNLATFLHDFEGIVIESQQLSALDHVLKATPAKWWGTHKQSISEWPQCQSLMDAIFDEEVTTVSHKYTCLLSPAKHINRCRTAFAEYPQQEWIHHFIHTLEIMPRSWYTSIELRG